MTIQLQRGLVSKSSLLSPVVATIGNFDGVHLGHKALLSQVVAEKKKRGSGSAIAISFYPHPAVALGRATKIPTITTLRQKLSALENIGIDRLVLIHFTKKFSSLSAAQFIDQVLLHALKVDTAVLGPDGTVGKDRKGNAQYVMEYLKEKGRESYLCEFYLHAGERVSSRRIREFIGNGEVEKATKFLGRPFEIEGRVVHGEGRGNKLGFPTANIVAPRQVVPRFGVYITSLKSRSNSYAAITNVGVRPTFGGDKLQIESFILQSIPSTLYDESISVSFHKWIRDEIKFKSADELKAQISLDIEEASRWHAAKKVHT